MANGLLYGNPSRGARPGSFPSLVGTTSAQFAPVHAERVRASELGLKISSHATRFAFAVYRYDDDGKQARGFAADPIFGTLPALVNIDRSRVQGADLDASWRVSGMFTLSCKAAHTDSKVVHYTGIDRSGKTVDFAGQSFPLTPRTQAMLGADLQFAFADADAASVGLDVDYASSTKGSGSFVLSNPAWAVPARTLADLRFGYRPARSRWSLAGRVVNLSDRYYWVNARQVNDVNARYAGRPRTLSVDLSYEMH